jgi:putative transposase
MPRRPRLFKPGYVYHVRQRGNNRTALFHSHEDYLIYLTFLIEAKKLYPCRIYGYCLMPNHIHLLIEAMQENNISLFMKYINGSYAMYVNKKYERTGTIFEGRFKAGLVQYEKYFALCMRYIELNPVKANLVKTPDQYPWSSYRFHAALERNSILDYDFWYLSLGDTFEERREQYTKFVNSETDDQDTNFIRERTNRNSVIGSDAFMHSIEEKSGINFSRVPGRPDKNIKQTLSCAS